MTTVVNLYGAPGAGKSTGAAYVFSKLKLDGVNCEYVPEFAKDKCWEDNKTVFAIPENQFFIGANQLYRMTVLKDKVDVIITDSPLYLNAFYNTSDALGKEYETVMFRLSEMFDNMNFLIHRMKAYSNAGRIQTAVEADRMAADLVEFLGKRSIEYMDVTGDVEGYEALYKTVKQRLNK